MSIPSLKNSFKIPFVELQFDEKVGSGGFGDVYRGTWLSNTVAIKQLQASTLTPETLADFEKETRIMAELRFPQIVHLWGVSLDRTPYCMVMEYLSKGSLHKVLHNPEPLTWPIRLQIATDVGIGLSYLHQRDIIHRDLKSLNVLLDDAYHAKIADFGLSKLKVETSTTTQNDKVIGTVRWMAPELFERRAKCTPASDVYSYGMVMWEIASRKIPFEDASNPAVIPTWIAKGERDDIPEECPDYYATLVSSCWAQNAKERPSASKAVALLQAGQAASATTQKKGSISGMQEAEMQPTMKSLHRDNMQTIGQVSAPTSSPVYRDNTSTSSQVSAPTISNPLQREISHFIQQRGQQKPDTRHVESQDLADSLPPNSLEPKDSNTSANNIDPNDKTVWDLYAAVMPELKPKNSSDLTKIAEEYYLLEQYDKALEVLDEALQLDPKNVFALALRGAVYRMGVNKSIKAEWENLKKQRSALAPPQPLDFYLEPGPMLANEDKALLRSLKDLDEALRLDPKNAFVFVNRAEVYRMRCNEDQALKDLDEALKLDPCYAIALVIRGSIYLTLHKHDQALKDLNQALKYKPRNTFALACRSVVYHAVGEYDKTQKDVNAMQRPGSDQLNVKSSVFRYLKLSIFITTLDHVKREPRNINEMPESPSKYTSALSKSGESYYLQKQCNKELDYCNEALKFNPQNAGLLAQRGLVNLKFGFNYKAREMVNEALKFEPNNAFALACRGAVYRMFKQYDRALNDLDQSLKLNPKDAFALASRGEVHRLLGEYDKALKDLNEALKFDPQNVVALVNRGEIYRMQGNDNEARKDLDAALNLDPNNAFALVCRGEIYRMQGDDDKALYDLKEALNLDPKNVVALVRRSEIYRRLGQYYNALKDLDRALQCNPQYALAFACRGELYRLLGEHAKALNDFDEAFKLNLRDAFVIARRGEVYFMLGQNDKALLNLDEALKLDPKDAFALACRDEVLIHIDKTSRSH